MAADDRRRGVLLLNLGGPGSLEEVRPFLYNLFSDREIIRLGPPPLQKPLAWLMAALRSRRTRKSYELIGGGSPLRRITEAQGRALEAELNGSWSVFIGMRYWRPYIWEAVQRALSRGVSSLVVMPLFPQYSRATTGSCFREVRRALPEDGSGMDVAYVQGWHSHPGYIDALVETVRQGLSRFTPEEREDVCLLFSAHALPQSLIDEGDPYVDQVMETAREVSAALNVGDWRVSFQSRSGPVRWTGPSTEETLRALASEGCHSLLMVPVSFVSDHLETLYEMDILYRRLAEGLGLTFSRAPALNTSPMLVKALAEIVKEAAERGGKD
ncbi:MAG: ferrochelatase [Methanobacteriota archaeon]|nr:MAG: ferrochelatase [Euryarchaeota archaeon]